MAGDNYLVSLTCNTVNSLNKAERGKLLSTRRLPIDRVQQRAKFKKETEVPGTEYGETGIKGEVCQ